MATALSLHAYAVHRQSMLKQPESLMTGDMAPQSYRHGTHSVAMPPRQIRGSGEPLD